MRSKAFWFSGLCSVFAASLLITCDPFQEDFIQRQKQVSLGQSEYYVLPNLSTIIDLQPIVQSYANATLKTNPPTRGTLTNISESILKYEPVHNFTDGKDNVGIMIMTNGLLLKTGNITLTMVQDQGQLPCSLYAVEDIITDTTGSAVSIAFLSNDRICGFSKENILSSIHVAPKHGSATLNGDAILYTRAAAYSGPDQLVYKLSTVGEGAITSLGIVTIVDKCELEFYDVYFDMTTGDHENAGCNNGGFVLPWWDSNISCQLSYRTGIGVSFLTQPAYGKAELCLTNQVSYTPKLLLVEEVKDDAFKINVNYKYPGEIGYGHDLVITFHIKRVPEPTDCIFKMQNIILDFTGVEWSKDDYGGPCEGYYLVIDLNQVNGCASKSPTSSIDTPTGSIDTRNNGTFCEDGIYNGFYGGWYAPNHRALAMNDTLKLMTCIREKGLCATKLLIVKRQ